MAAADGRQWRREKIIRAKFAEDGRPSATASLVATNQPSQPASQLTLDSKVKKKRKKRCLSKSVESKQVRVTENENRLPPPPPQKGRKLNSLSLSVEAAKIESLCEN